HPLFSEYDLAATVYDLVVLPDGKLLLSLGALPDSDPALLRLDGNGTPDPTFGTAGGQTVALGINARIDDLLLQDDGTILIGGVVGGVQDLFVGRLNADGTLDADFAGGGKIQIDFG